MLTHSLLFQKKEKEHKKNKKDKKDKKKKDKKDKEKKEPKSEKKEKKRKDEKEKAPGKVHEVSFAKLHSAAKFMVSVHSSENGQFLILLNSEIVFRSCMMLLVFSVCFKLVRYMFLNIIIRHANLVSFSHVNISIIGIFVRMLACVIITP